MEIPIKDGTAADSEIPERKDGKRACRTGEKGINDGNEWINK